MVANRSYCTPKEYFKGNLSYHQPDDFREQDFPFPLKIELYRRRARQNLTFILEFK